MGISRPLVAIVLLNWNGQADTVACLESIRGFSYGNCRVILVDNGSTDSIAEAADKALPGTALVELQTNLGFTGGNNVGIRHALDMGADYVWLLNNDTVVDPDCLGRLVEYAEAHDDVGLVSPAIHYFDDPSRVQYTSVVVDWEHCRLLSPDDTEALSVPAEDGTCRQTLFGTALLVKRAVFEKIGVLREDLFAYWEDVEFCVRAFREGGYRNAVVHDARVLHKCPLPEVMREQKSPYYYYFMARNRFFFWMQYVQGAERSRFVRSFIAETLCDGAALHYKGAGERRDACLDGLWHALKGRKGPWDKNSRMPALLQRFLLWHPYFLAKMIAPQH